jgi:hypothetical protein
MTRTILATEFVNLHGLKLCNNSYKKLSNKKKPKTLTKKEPSFEDESDSSSPLNEQIKQLLMVIKHLIKMGKSTTEGGGLRLVLPPPPSNKQNKPTCARVAAMTTWAQNKSKQHSFNVKVSFSLVLPYASCSFLS